jgi:pimeloyl-ACP methyl ester carboxylesterase
MDRRQIEGRSVLVGSWPLQEGRPTLLFIHGAGQSALFWRAQLDAFEGVANTVAVDLPGHGSNEQPPLTSIEEQASALASWIRSASLPDPVPVGLSMGGAITGRMLLDEPGLVRTAALLSTGARLRVASFILHAIRSDFPSYVASIEVAAVSRACTLDLSEIFADMGAQNPAAVEADFIACNAFDVRGELGRVAVPTLVLGGGDDMLTPPKIVKELAGILPNSRHVELEATGHLAPAERPDEVNRELSALIA